MWLLGEWLYKRNLAEVTVDLSCYFARLTLFDILEEETFDGLSLFTVSHQWCEPQQIQGVFLPFLTTFFDPLLISYMSFLPKSLLLIFCSLSRFSQLSLSLYLLIYIFITNSVFLTQISILGSRITHSTLYSISPIVCLTGNPNIIHPNLTHNMLFHLNNPYHSPSYLSNKL